MHGRSLHGNREISRPTIDPRIAGPHREGRRAEADDARTGEVGPCHSSWEVGERGRAAGRGGDGAKGRGRGERGPGWHAPDTAPGERVPRAGPRTANGKRKAKGEVHRSAPPSRRRLVALGLLPAQAGSGGGGGRADVAR